VKTFTLETLAGNNTDDVFDIAPPFIIELKVSEHLSPSVIKNLAKLKKLGVCNADAVLSILGQAPVDPINLMGTLMQQQPDGWAFSAIDFSMIRVLARNAKKAVSAALRVDLMSTSISGLALNKAGQLTIFKTLEVEPGPNTLNDIQTLCDETIAASVRETKL
jgi:hypothetical protein